MQRVSTDRLVRDLGAVAADVDELVKSTAGNASEAMADARARSNTYLRDNVWRAMGVAAGIGLLLGAIVGLRSQSSGSRSD